MMKKILLFSIVGLMLMAPSQAHAILIVDTGSGGPQFGVSIYNRTNGDYQFNAGQFTINQAYTISSIETWMYSVDAGTVEMVLYGDNANLPDPSNEILRQSFNVAAPGPITAWQGLTGLNQTLNPGSYWISLEKSIPTDGFSVNLPTGVPNPLAYYAYRAEEDNGGDWIEYTGGQGFRVWALDSSAVPEPATMFLFTTGLLGVFLRRPLGQK